MIKEQRTKNGALSTTKRLQASYSITIGMDNNILFIVQLNKTFVRLDVTPHLLLRARSQNNDILGVFFLNHFVESTFVLFAGELPL